MNFITTDALVQIQDQGVEKIVLMQRKTGLRLAPQAAHEALRGQAVFDHPGRSNKGRIVTHAYHLHLGVGPAPVLCAGDNVTQADWHPVKTVLQWRRALHDDHTYIVQHFLG